MMLKEAVPFNFNFKIIFILGKSFGILYSYIEV